jgi:hypothetical protein
METTLSRPDRLAPSLRLIRGLLESRQFAAVLFHVAPALATMPDEAELHFAHGTALNELHRPLAARAALTRAVVLRPNLAPAWLNLGNACADLDETEEAERHYRTALRLDPGLAAAHASLGHLLHANGHLPEAIAVLQEAVRLDPGMAQAHWNLATALLLVGDMPPGWREFEWRKRHPAFRADFPPLPGPYWSGGGVEGKVILVRTEQGAGDTIQFARFLPAIVAMGGTPVLLCDPALVRLLTGLPGVVVLPRTAKVEGHDAWTDLLSLPLALGGAICPDPYLRPDPARVAAWRALLASPTLPLPSRERADGRAPSPGERPNMPFRVGIAWAGNPAQANDRRRSMPGAALAPLLALPGVQFVNLQVGARAGEIGLPDLSPRLTDFAETAALIATLDLVVTVDTSIAHLAGALGVPVWAMLAHVPDWRWLLNRDDSPWYASARLFRQDRAGDWDAVVRRVTEALDRKRSAPR